MNTQTLLFACITTFFAQGIFPSAGYSVDNTRIKTILSALDNDIATQQTDSFPQTMALTDDKRIALEPGELFSINITAGYLAAQKIGFSSTAPDCSYLIRYLNAVSHRPFSNTNRLILDFYKPLINVPNAEGIMPIFSCAQAPRYVIGLYLRGARIDSETVTAAQRQLKKWPSLLATLHLLHDNKQLFEPFMPKPKVKSAAPAQSYYHPGPAMPTALTYIKAYTPNLSQWIAEEQAHITAVEQQDSVYVEQLKNQMHADAQIVHRPLIRDEIRFMANSPDDE